VQISMPVDTRRNKRKPRREFRQTGYSAVYLEVSGYPPGKRDLAHETSLLPYSLSGFRMLAQGKSI